MSTSLISFLYAQGFLVRWKRIIFRWLEFFFFFFFFEGLYFYYY